MKLPLQDGQSFIDSQNRPQVVGGEIIQRATVVGCKAGDRPQELIVARYPSLPLSFERICPGFQAVLLEGHDDLSLPRAG